MYTLLKQKDTTMDLNSWFSFEGNATFCGCCGLFAIIANLNHNDTKCFKVSKSMIKQPATDDCTLVWSWLGVQAQK